MPDEEKPESSPGEETEVAEPEAEQPEASAEETEQPESSPDTESEAGQAESAEAPEASTKRSEPRSNAETRIRQLTAQLKDLKRQVEAVKPAEAAKPKPTEPALPKLTDFETVELYDAAMTKYRADYGEYRERVAVERDRAEREAAAKKAETDKAEAAARDAWQKREAETRKRNPDFITKDALEVVQPSQIMDGFFVDSEIGPDVLDHLAAHPEEADKIRDLPPYRQVRELIRIETKLHDQIKGIKRSGPPPKPANYVSGSGASPSRPKDAADVLYR